MKHYMQVKINVTRNRRVVVLLPFSKLAAHLTLKFRNYIIKTE